jgi:hypothetical protein
MATADGYKVAREYLTEDELEFFEALDHWLGLNRKWDKHPHWEAHNNVFESLISRAWHRLMTETGTWATGEPYDGTYKVDAAIDLEPFMRVLERDLQQDNLIDAITRKY